MHPPFHALHAAWLLLNSQNFEYKITVGLKAILTVVNDPHNVAHYKTNFHYIFMINTNVTIPSKKIVQLQIVKEPSP